MKIYLSSYWKKSCVFCAIFVAIVVVSTVMFCIWSQDKEDYVLIIGSLLFIFLFGYLINTSLKLVRYIKVENNNLVMYSFCKKAMCAINLEAVVYYEILPLIESAYTKKEYIILSNFPFESFQKRSAEGLAKICKLIDTNGNQIISPFNNQFSSNLLNIDKYYKI